MSRTFPETSSPYDGDFADVPSPKKSIGKDWGAHNEAAHKPNTPTMTQATTNASVNPYADYCDESSGRSQGNFVTPLKKDKF
jgi:hypothetical protein